MLSVTKTASPACFDIVRSIGVTLQREWEEGDFKRAREIWGEGRREREVAGEKDCRERAIAGEKML